MEKTCSYFIPNSNIGNRINCQCLYREEAQNGSAWSKVFCKKGVFKTFVKFKGKHLCQSIFFIKLQASGDCFCQKKKKKTAALKLKAKSIRCYSHVFNKKARKSWMYVGLCQMMEFFRKINHSLLPSTVLQKTPS